MGALPWCSAKFPLEMSLAHRGTESEGLCLNYVCNFLIIMYPKEYIQKDEGLEDLERKGAEEFGKITAWKESTHITCNSRWFGDFFPFYNKVSLLLCSLPHRTFNINLGHKLYTRWIITVTESSARKPRIAIGEWSRSGWKRDQREGEDLGKCHSVSLLEKHFFMWKSALFILPVASGHACSHRITYYRNAGCSKVMLPHAAAPLGSAAK